MRTIKLTTGETVHDFRPQSTGWGWNGLSWLVSEDKKTASMTGIGTGLKMGDFIALRHGQGDFGYEIEKIEYLSNPIDMFQAIVRGPYVFQDGELG